MHISSLLSKVFFSYSLDRCIVSIAKFWSSTEYSKLVQVLNSKCKTKLLTPPFRDIPNSQWIFGIPLYSMVFSTI